MGGAVVAGFNGGAGHAGNTAHAGTGGMIITGGSGTGGMIITGGSGEGGGVAGSTGPIPFDAGDPSLNAVQPGGICERLTTIQCAGEAHCCLAPNRTIADCKAAQLQACNDTYLDQIAANQITAFDATYAKMAFDQLQTMASMCDPNVAEWGSSYTGLLGILKGTIAAGRACTPKGNVNDKAVIAAALASCLDLPHTACMPVPPSVSEPLPTWTCDAKGAAGANCFTDANCMDGLYCDNPQVKLSSKNTCKVRKQPGEGCVNPNECASFFCKKSVCVAKDVQPAYCLQNN